MYNRYAFIFLAMLLYLTAISAWAQPTGRITSNLVALYPFDEGSGSTVHDISGYGSALNLSIGNTSRTNWITGGGISINNGTIIQSATAATKIIDACKSSDQLTIEAWIKPDNTSQSGPARIVSLSYDPYDRNFTMGQEGSQYSLRARTGSSDNNGSRHELNGGSPSASQVHHLVMTVDSSGDRKTYINGILVASRTGGIDFAFWDRSYKFALANELTNDRSWLGDMHLVAIYNSALSPTQIAQNYQAGYNSAGAGGGQVVATGMCNWSEGFGLSDGTQSDNGLSAWSTTYTGAGHWGVYGGKFKGNDLDTELSWESEVVSISSSSNAYITLKARSEGSMENVDYIKMYYVLDGGTPVMFASRNDNFNNDNEETFTINGLSGSTLQLIVKMYNTSTAETHYIDDVEINCGSSSGVILPPSSPSCNSGDLQWQANVTVNGTSVSSSHRLIENSQTHYTIYDNNLPAAFGGAVEVSIDEAISWDGYSSRSNANQPYEQWRVVFVKNGNIEWASDYTDDLADNAKSAEFKGSLGTAVLPNGADKIIIAHKASSTYGDGRTNNTANSVVPSSICIDYEALTCDNLTSGGQIAGDESQCGTYDPAPMTSVMLPSGGSGAIEYVWLMATSPIAANASNASMIPNSNGPTYDPGPINQTTYYRRCARRAGCTDYLGESNDIVKTVLVPPSALVNLTDASCNGNDGEISFSFSDTDGRTNIEFSIDGGNTYPLNVLDNTGSTSFTGLSSGSYDVYVRWGNNECPVFLGSKHVGGGPGDPSCNAQDFGDAPACYGIAEHGFRNGISIGALWDGEPVSAFSGNAQGDDADGADDEDGITFVGGTSGAPGETKQVKVVVNQKVDFDDFIIAWIDFDGNCQFDTDERIIDNHQVFQSQSPQTFTFSYTIPQDASPGPTYARFRYSSDAMNAPTGSKSSGEVEDYEFAIDCNLSVSIADADLDCLSGSDTLNATLTGQSQGTPGLKYSYYEQTNMSVLPDFSTMRPVKRGNVANFDLSPRNRNDNFAFVYEGYINILFAGSYTFYTNSDDGSRLYIGGQEVVDNDGLHSTREESGSITLTAGFHPIKVMYFERTGGAVLQVKYEGPGTTKQLIPSSVLFCNLASRVGYAWTGPNGFTSSMASPIITESGTYFLTVTDSSTGCSASDTVVVTGSGGSITDAGEIAPFQYLCGNPFLPDTVGSVRDAGKGASGVEYRWLVSEDPNAPLTTWWIKAGANKPYLAFDGPIKKPCWFIRQARRCDSSWINSNVSAVITRFQPRPSFTIDYPEGSCVSPGNNLTINFDARKWGSRSNVYTWFFPASNDTDGELQGPADPTDPRALAVRTSYSAPGTYQAYLTIAWADQPGVASCDSTIVLTFDIDDCGGCDNITDAGTIFGNQASCSSPLLTDSIGGPPSTGGSGGSIEYFWIYTQDPYLPPSLWSSVPGGSGTDKTSILPSALLGPLDTTTYFIRCSRRISCNAHLESNVVVIEVDPSVRQKCTSLEVDSLGYSIRLTGMDAGSHTDTYVWTGGEGKLTSYADGSARLEGLIENAGNANLKFYAFFELSPVMDWLEWQNDSAAQAGQYLANPLGDGFTHQSWDYYRINTETSKLVGFGFYGGDTLFPTSSGLTQVGVGANTENMNYGIYTSFEFGSKSGVHAGKASFQNDFDKCVDVCPNLPRVSAKLMLNGAYNINQAEMVPELGPNRFLAQSQPFGVWGYNGTEKIDSVDYAINPVMNDVVTWVMIELRTRDNILELQGRKAGLLLRDGSIVAPDLKSLVELDANPDTEYYIGAKTLGYFGVLTAVPSMKMGRVLTVDFTKFSNVFQVYDQSADPAMVEITPGLYGLIEGDAIGEGNVDGPDIQAILNNFGLIGQYPTDLDVNGITDGLDIQRALLNLLMKTNMLDYNQLAPDPGNYMYNTYKLEDFDEDGD